MSTSTAGGVVRWEVYNRKTHEAPVSFSTRGAAEAWRGYPRPFARLAGLPAAAAASAPGTALQHVHVPIVFRRQVISQQAPRARRPDMTALVSATVHTVIDTPLGPLTLVGEAGALTGIYFAPHRRRDRLPDFGLATTGEPVLEAAAHQLGEYFRRERRDFDLPLAPDGDEFQQSVWALLRQIPYGETRSYGDLARAVGRPGAAQAVGWANGSNPLSIVVPCHRVIGSDGSLTGYAGGLDRKRFLLELERPPAEDDGRLF